MSADIHNYAFYDYPTAVPGPSDNHGHNTGVETPREFDAVPSPTGGSISFRVIADDGFVVPTDPEHTESLAFLLPRQSRIEGVYTLALTGSVTFVLSRTDSVTISVTYHATSDPPSSFTFDTPPAATGSPTPVAVN